MRYTVTITTSHTGDRWTAMLAGSAGNIKAVGASESEAAARALQLAGIALHPSLLPESRLVAEPEHHATEPIEISRLAA
ncbi:MAG TPA: hypothetical protein VLA96_01950 [Terriglobales bacterium]|nr:hypothetical protein [Terriglobales bacterium]